MYKFLYKFFDKFEDRVRQSLSRFPLFYTLVGAVAIIIFWTGVEWTLSTIKFLNGPILIGIGLVIMLATGLFIPFFIGDSILISGLKKEKKISEKTEDELREETLNIKEVKSELKKIEETLESLQKK